MSVLRCTSVLFRFCVSKIIVDKCGVNTGNAVISTGGINLMSDQKSCWQDRTGIWMSPERFHGPTVG